MGVRGQPTKWDKWYSTARWATIRKHQLLQHPLCKYCAERGIVTPATICDHVEPHHGDVNKFWLGPFQSLCKRYHDSTKRLEKRRLISEVPVWQKILAFTPSASEYQNPPAQRLR